MCLTKQALSKSINHTEILFTPIITVLDEKPNFSSNLHLCCSKICTILFKGNQVDCLLLQSTAANFIAQFHAM